MHPQPPVPLLGPAMAGLTDGLVARAESDRLLAPLFLALAALFRVLFRRFDAIVALHNAGLLPPEPAPAPRTAPTPRPTTPQQPEAQSTSWRDLLAWWPWHARAEAESARFRYNRAPSAHPRRAAPQPRATRPALQAPASPSPEPAPQPRPRAHSPSRPAFARPCAPSRRLSRHVPPTPSRKNRLPVLV